MKKRVVSLGLAAMMAMSMTACGGSGNASTSESAAEDAQGAEGADGEVFKIGGIGPITGAAGAYGEAVKNGTELAINEINEAGGINGYQVAFNFQDDENDPEKAVNAYNTLKDWNMQMLLGTVTSKPCIAVVAETAADNLFQLTPSGSAVESISGDNAFRVCYSDPDQGRASAQYIGEHKLATKIAIIYDSSSEYSDGIRESFVAEAPNQGLEVVSSEAFTSDNNTDFSVQLDKAKESGADLVFLPIYYQEASVILKQANDKDFHPQFFGCDGMDGILSVDGFDKSLAEGLMLLTPFSVDEESSQDFVTAYRDAYGIDPLQFAADAYDGVYAIKAAAEKAEITPDMENADISAAMSEAMLSVELDGLTGKAKWTEDGECDKEPKAFEIQDGAYVEMD